MPSAEVFYLLYRLLTVCLSASSGSPLEARFTLKVSVHIGRLRRPGIVGAHRQGQKGERAPYGSLSPS